MRIIFFFLNIVVENESPTNEEKYYSSLRIYLRIKLARIILHSYFLLYRYLIVKVIPENSILKYIFNLRISFLNNIQTNKQVSFNKIYVYSLSQLRITFVN